MQRRLLSTALLIGTLLATGCQSKEAVEVKNNGRAIATETTEIVSTTEMAETADSNQSAEAAPAPNSASIPVAQTAPEAAIAPTQPPSPAQSSEREARLTSGTLLRAQTGDIACYLHLTDENNQRRGATATFNLCPYPQSPYLGQKVKLTYTLETMPDCEQIAPCGKTKQEIVVSQIEPIGPAPAQDSATYVSSLWTITVSNINSWDGVNNTGNLSYRGCDIDGNCLELTGGAMSCRDGQCGMGWKNGDYHYSIAFSMANPETGEPITGKPPKLVVRQNGEVILEETFRS